MPKASDAYPKRNLPGSAEDWGRRVEGVQKDLDDRLLNLEQSVGIHASTLYGQSLINQTAASQINDNSGTIEITTAEPQFPGGVSVTSNVGYWLDDGTAKSVVIISFNPVVKDINNRDINIEKYELWSSAGGAEKTFNISSVGTTISYDGWIPGVEVKFALRAKSIYGIASGLSQDVIVTPADPANIVPKAPVNLVTDSNTGSFAANNAAIATINVSWDAVTESTDNDPITVPEYEVWINGAPFVRTVTNSIQFTAASGSVNLVRVRAKSIVNAWGDLSAAPGLSITAASPSVVTRIPTAPILTTSLGIVTAKWDGSFVRTNLVTNPSLETNILNIASSAGTGGTNALTRETSGGWIGTSFARATWSVGTTAVSGNMENVTSATTTVGATYTGSAYVRVNSAQRLILQATGTSVGTTTATAVDVPANTWTRLSYTHANVTTAGTLNIRVSVSGGRNWVAGDTLDVDGWLLEASSTLGDYFDGSLPDTADWDYGWTGAANTSTSTAKTLNRNALGYGVGSVFIQQFVGSTWTNISALDSSGSTSIQSTKGETVTVRFVAYDGANQVTGTSAQSSIVTTGVEYTDINTSLENYILTSGAHVTKSATEPASGILGDLWFKSSVSGTIENIYIHNGTSFVLYQMIADSILVANSVTAKTLNADEIFADAATLNSLKAGAISVGILTTDTIQGSGDITLIAGTADDAKSTADQAFSNAGTAQDAADAAAGAASDAQSTADTANQNITETRTRFIVTTTGAKVQSADATKSVNIEPTGINIVQNGVTISSWTDAKFSVDNMTVTQKAEIGGHVMEKFSTGRTTFKALT